MKNLRIYGFWNIKNSSIGCLEINLNRLSRLILTNTSQGRHKIFLKKIRVGPRLWKASSILLGTSQPAFTCSNLTIETLEQGVKYVQSLLLTLNM